MRAFEDLVGDLEYPMFIVTAPGPLGCLVGFTTQASIDPARFIICLSHKNRTFREGGEEALVLVTGEPVPVREVAA